MSKVSTGLLKKIFPGTPNAKLSRFVRPFNEILPKYDITNKKRFAAFIANVGIESDRLKALKEYASGTNYEGRKSLGNVRNGDGVRYKGRSVLQTTGRYNYWRVVVAYLRVLTGKDWNSTLAERDFDKYLKSAEYDKLLKEADKYNVNFLAHPELLEEFPHAIEAAGVFVKDNNLNNYADNGQFYAYAGVLNRGSARKKALHYDQRKALYDLAMRIIPDNFNLDNNDVEDSAIDVNIEGDAHLHIKEEIGTENDNVKVEVSDGNVKVETNTGSLPIKEKVAIIAPKPIKWYSGMGTKITTAITSNALFIWLSDKFSELIGVINNPVVWYVIIGLVAAGTLIWLWHEAKENSKKKDRDAELIRELIIQNSTPTNELQVIDQSDATLFALRGWKIRNAGESVPKDVADTIMADTKAKEEE